MRLHRYVYYGLGVHSEFPLWGDGEADCPRDVTVRWLAPDAPAADVERQVEREGGGDCLRLHWPHVGEMTISRTRIVVHGEQDAESGHLRHLVSGIGLGLVLHLRGVFALHASAVALDGHAVAFVGAKGAGKSTIAAALSARGHTLLSDDVVAIDLPGDSAPLVRQGPTNLNLWPDSAAATGHRPAELPRIWSHSPKLAGWLATRAQSVTPLGAVYMLATTEGPPRVGERLSSLDAFAQLVGHTHAFRWVDASSCLPHHLGQCRELLERVPVYRAERGRSLDSLDVLVRGVEEHATTPAIVQGPPPGVTACR